MTYTPHRTMRFEYATELIEYIEQRQCRRCDHGTGPDEYPMCELAGVALDCDPIEVWDEVAPDVVVCRRGPEPTS